MLGKLLKYDFKSVWRVWWIVAVSVFGVSFVGAFALRFMLSEVMNTELSDVFALVGVASILILVLCVFAIVASVLLTEILVYLRYYKHFFTDEGYLTFTLPVSRKDLLLSKTINAIIWMGMQVLLLAACAGIFMLISPPSMPGEPFINLFAFRAVGQWIATMAKELGAGWLILYAIAGLLILTAVLVFSTSLVHFCITVGAVVAKKAKLLAAIGIYYLVNMGFSFVSQFLGLFVFGSMTQRFNLLLEGLPMGTQRFAVLLALLLVGTVAAAVASVMYFLTLGKLERKLNLA